MLSPYAMQIHFAKGNKHVDVTLPPRKTNPGISIIKIKTSRYELGVRGGIFFQRSCVLDKGKDRRDVDGFLRAKMSEAGDPHPWKHWQNSPSDLECKKEKRKRGDKEVEGQVRS